MGAVETSGEVSGGVNTSRRLWTLFEPVHAVTYFAPQARAAYEAVGLRGFWRSYFAGRVAPLGRLEAGAVTALFYNFAPVTVNRAFPDLWNRTTPEDALRVREDGAVASLADLFEKAGTDTDLVAEAVALLDDALGYLDHSGRALGGANAALPQPDRPLARLWHATTVLREHRGDGHIAAAVTEGIDGCEVLVLRSTLDGTDGSMQRLRGWTTEEWAAAQGRLADRGWLTAQGAITDAGRAVYQRVEDVTNRLAAAPWQGLGAERLERLVTCLTPLARATAAVMPFPNPVGLSAPA